MRDVKARRRFISFIASEIALQSEIRETIIKGVLPEIATRRELKSEISALEDRINRRLGELERSLKEYVDVKISEVENRLSQRIDALEKRIEDLNTSLNRRIDDVHVRISELHKLLRSTFIALIIALATALMLPLLIQYLTRII